MKKERMIRRSQHMTWWLAALAGICLMLLLVGQYVVLSSAGRQWTVVGKLEGAPLTELDDQTLLAGSVQKAVQDVRLTASGQSGLVRLYIDDHLTQVLAAGATVHLALESGQKLAADGGQLEEALILEIAVEGLARPEVSIIEPGAWQELVWEM